MEKTFRFLLLLAALALLSVSAAADGENVLTLPENLTVNVTEKVYQGTVTDDGTWTNAYPDFYANTRNPLFIPVE